MKHHEVLLPFSSEPICGKCHGADIKTEYKVSYRKGNRHKDGKGYIAKPERLHRKCMNCKHWWIEQCGDHVGEITSLPRCQKKPVCLNCGDTKVETKSCRGMIRVPGYFIPCPDRHVEHQHKYCGCCGYEWPEQYADNKLKQTGDKSR